MSYHTAKAHFSNALNNADNNFKKEICQGLVAMADALREQRNDTDKRLRSLETAVAALKSR